MQNVMFELAGICGFYFEAQTFPELFLFMFLAICGTSILASIIKVMMFIALNSHKIGR